MPGPLAIIGLSFLGGVISKIFVSMVETLGKYMTKKLAVRVIFAATVVGMLAAFVGVIESLILGIPYLLPAGMDNLLVMVLPNNTSFCIGACITATIARRVYEMYVEYAKFTYLGF